MKLNHKLEKTKELIVSTNCYFDISSFLQLNHFGLNCSVSHLFLFFEDFYVIHNRATSLF